MAAGFPISGEEINIDEEININKEIDIDEEIN